MSLQLEALAAGMNEEIVRQNVVLEAYVRRNAELEAALRGIINHWNEFGEMMGVKDDYGLSERLDAAEKLVR